MTARIICIGDSITRGTVRNSDGSWPSPCYPSYRYPLWQRLQQGGHAVSYVGPWTAPDYPSSLFNFPQQNAAKNDNTTGNCADRIASWPAADIAICIVGTEDAFNQVPVATRVANVRRMIDALRAKNGSVKIVIAQIPPTDNDYRNSTQVTPFNSAVAAVTDRSASASPVVVLDLYSGFSKSWLNGIRNPNGTGDTWIAGRVYETIRPWLAGSSAAPVAEFVGSPASGNAPLTVTFTNQTAASGCTWSWSFGDGGTSTAQSPSHTYSSAGTYTVTLTATNAGGTNTKTRTGYVAVAGTSGIVADFTYAPNPPNGTVPLVVTVQDASAPPADSCAWNFGDGVTATGRLASHTYRTPGTYAIALTATKGAFSDTETKAGLVTAGLPPVMPGLPGAAFSAMPLSGEAPLTVVFMDQSIGIPSSWLWDFGDGKQSVVASPVHQYLNPGTYTVSLTIANAFGSDVETKTGYITVSTPAAAVLAARFSANVTTTETVPFTVQFKDDSTGTPTTWSWSFGDGGTSRLQHPTHTYTAPGVYSVTLVVENATGETDAETQTDFVRIGEAPTPPMFPLPACNFMAAPTNVATGSPVTFTDISDLKGGHLQTSEWVFGDGERGTGASIAHIYRSPGTYTIEHAVTTEFGSGAATRANYITVTTGPPPVSLLTASFVLGQGLSGSGDAPLAIRFVDTSTGDPTTWFWMFGDGATSEEQNPVHYYRVPGIYSVVLQVERPDPRGSSLLETDAVEAERLITVRSGIGMPVPSFNILVPTGAAPLTVPFVDTSTGPPTSWEWDFGDGGTSTAQHPTHTYEAIGVYDITLRVSNATGTRGATAVSGVIVVESDGAPTAAFMTPTQEGIAPLLVPFIDRSTNHPTSWSWSFGDGATSTEQSPVHEYAAPGIYTVTLVATNTHGSDTETVANMITVVATPAALGGTEFTADGDLDLLSHIATTWIYAEVEDTAGTLMRPRFALPSDAYVIQRADRTAIITLRLRGSDMAALPTIPYVPARLSLFETIEGGECVWDETFTTQGSLQREADEITIIAEIPLEGSTNLIRAADLAFGNQVEWGTALQTEFSFAGGSSERIQIQDVEILTPEVAWGGHLVVTFLVTKAPNLPPGVNPREE
jgi:PKD repeat protein